MKGIKVKNESQGWKAMTWKLQVKGRDEWEAQESKMKVNNIKKAFNENKPCGPLTKLN